MPKPADIDNDGRNDWDSNSDTHVEGNTFIDGWVTDNDAGGNAGDEMTLVIGHDLNGDGRLENNEISHIIGKCRIVPGINTIKIFPVSGGHVIHHWNWRDANGNGRMDAGEAIWHYVYNTKTGKLRVFNANGELIFNGDPEDYFGR